MEKLNNRPRKCLDFKTPNQVLFGINPPIALASWIRAEFFVAYILILIFSTYFKVFSSLANISDSTPLLEKIYRTTLPALALTLVIVAHMMRMTRAAIINLLASPYIEMAQLKGVSKGKVILHYALSNAWGPIINVIAFNLAYLVVGVVVVEVVFVYPGLGQLMVDAVSSCDIPVVQASALIFAGKKLFRKCLAYPKNCLANGLVQHDSD